jgi:CO/xanthine dehydrogenase Mo-binding subunit
MTDKLIGKSIKRIDVKDKVTGQAKYPGDFSRPNQAYMKVVFAEKSHAIVKSIDVSKAEAVEGVLMVLTAKDVPHNVYGLMKADQPVLCGPGSDVDGTDRVRFIGDQVALVIAENEEIAKRAAGLIEIEFEDLPLVTTLDQAMEKGAFLLHDDCPANEMCHFKIRYGELEKGFEAADVIIEGDYYTPTQEHVFLQPEAGLAYVDENERVTVIVAGQWTHEDQEQIAHSLNLPLEKVRVIYPAIGGAFGGREDMSVQIVLALAAVKLHEAGIKRPVKTVWSRRESLIGHHKRHPYKIHTKWGATKAGKLTAMEAEIIADSGAYMYTSNKVLANATLMISGPYFIPNVKVDAKAVATNTVPNGAFRGFGGPQACFAAEMQMSKLAEALDMDPVEFRLLNTIKEGQELPVRSAPPKGISIDHVIQTCAEAAGWRQENGKWVHPDHLKDDGEIVHGIGISAGYKNVGFSYGAPENCWAGVEIVGTDEIEEVILKHAGADVGQGAHSVFVQLAAEVIGVPIEKVRLIASDTAETGNSGSASASRMTFMAGNAIIGAAEAALAKWKSEERPAKASFVYRPPATTPMDPETGACMPNFSYGYAADAIEVSVNTKTGKVLINKVICSDDVGRALNPQQVKGQIEGAIVQAAGYSLLEDFIQKDGKVLTDSLATYLIPTIMDIPDKTESIIIEDIDPIGPMGARGVGEMPYMPFAPAVLAAVHDAIGVWYNRFPLTEERILEGLGVLKKGR